MRNAGLTLTIFLLVASARLHAAPSPDGEAIFGQNCAGCHGTAGAGGRGPSLRGPLRNGNQASDIQKVISNGLPGTGMPKFELEADELQALVTYVQSLSHGPPSKPHPIGDKLAGRRVYDAQGCAGCHKIGTEGSAFGPDLTRIGASRSYDYLKTSILNPSADVPETYQGVTVIAQDGKRYRGVRVNEDSFTLQLRLPDQHFASFDKQTLRQEIIEKQSPMPAYKLDERDLNNLLEYLSDLTGSAGPASAPKEQQKMK
jgi:putative heme-binding domain-containing protein